MNGNIFQIYLIIQISRGTSNCVKHVFEKKHVYHYDTSPHFKFLFSDESLDFFK